jgi:hypothetical protein
MQSEGDVRGDIIVITLKPGNPRSNTRAITVLAAGLWAIFGSTHAVLADFGWGESATFSVDLRTIPTGFSGTWADSGSFGVDLRNVNRGWGDSNPFGVEGELPPVSTDIRIVSLDMDYGEGVYVSGVDIANTVKAVVDWGGEPAGQVVFELGSTSTAVSGVGGAAQTSFNMGSDLDYALSGERNTLVVYAQTPAGAVSAPLKRVFYGLALPEWAVSAATLLDLSWAKNPLTNRLTYSGDVRIVLDPTDPEGKLKGTINIPNSIPEVGGRWGVEINPLEFWWELAAEAQFGEGEGITGEFDLGGSWGAAAKAGKKREGTIAASLSGMGEFYPSFRLTDVSGELAGQFSFRLPRVPLLCQWTGCCSTAHCPYFQATISPGLSGTVAFEEGEPDLVAGLRFKDGELYLEAELKGTVGLGEDGGLYDVHGGIGGTPYLTLQFPKDPVNFCGNEYIQEVGFNLSAEATVQVASWWKREWEWEFDIYHCPETQQTIRYFREIQDGSIVRLVDRGYLAAPEGYCTFSIAHSSDGFRAVSGLPAPILNVGTAPFPSVAATSDRGLLAFVYDDADKPLGENQEIYFARWSDGTWTAHAPLTSNNRPDLQPKTAIDSNGTELVVWIQGNQPTGLETGPRDSLPGFEIAYADFDSDGGVWSSPRVLTSNGFPDLLPWFDDSGGLRTLWLRSTTNGIPVWHDDVIKPSIDVMAADWDGAAFGSPYLIAAGLSAVTPPAIARTTTHEFLAYAEDIDTNSATADDREIVVRSRPLGGTWGNDVQLTSDFDFDTSVHMALDTNGMPLVVWTKRMVPVSVPDEDDTRVDQLWFATWDGTSWGVPQLAVEFDGITESRLIRNEAGRFVLFWVSASEEFSDIYYSVYDASLGLWGEPQQITHDTGAETMISLALSGGNVLAGYVKRRVDLATTNGLPEIGLSDIYLLEHAPTRDLVVASNGFTFDPDPVEPGTPNTVCVDVTATGDFTVEDVGVEFYEGAVGSNGALIGTDTIARLLPGESQPACFTWNVPTNGIEQTLFAVVDPANTIPELDETTNNTASIGVFKPDLRISAPAVTGYPGADTVLIGCSVRNSGTALAGGSKLEVRRDNAAGELVFSTDVSGVPAGEAALVQFAWDVSALTGGIYELYFATDVDQSVAEANELNNIATIGVPVLGDLRAEQWSGTFDIGTAGIVIRNAGAKPMAASIVRATVGAVTYGKAAVPALNPGESTTVSMIMSQAVPTGWLDLTANPDSDGTDEVTLLNNTATAVVNASGDWDGDGDFDLSDFVGFTDCLAGPGAMPSPTAPATANECLAVFDFDADADVDVADYGKITNALLPG